MAEILIGLVSGIISGTGMGGGTILILLLSLINGLDQHIAQATNLVFFIPTAIAAIIVSIKNKKINFKIAIPICIWGIIGAAIGAIVSSKMNVNILRKFFGIFLLVIAIEQIYSLYKEYRRAKKKT